MEKRLRILILAMVSAVALLFSAAVFADDITITYTEGGVEKTLVIDDNASDEDLALAAKILGGGEGVTLVSSVVNFTGSGDGSGSGVAALVEAIVEQAVESAVDAAGANAASGDTAEQIAADLKADISAVTESISAALGGSTVVGDGAPANLAQTLEQSADDASDAAAAEVVVATSPTGEIIVASDSSEVPEGSDTINVGGDGSQQPADDGNTPDNNTDESDDTPADDTTPDQTPSGDGSSPDTDPVRPPTGPSPN